MKKATWNTEHGMQYDWSALTAAALAAGIDADELKQWVFDCVTDDLTADEAVAAYRRDRQAKADLETL